LRSIRKDLLPRGRGGATEERRQELHLGTSGRKVEKRGSPDLGGLHVKKKTGERSSSDAMLDGYGGHKVKWSEKGENWGEYSEERLRSGARQKGFQPTCGCRPPGILQLVRKSQSLD